jgi:hypothetical protein
MNPSVRPSFQRKVEVLEKWVNEGLPERDVFWPRNVDQLASWEDPYLGVTAWRSPKIVVPKGKYGDLRLRFDKAIEKLGGRTAVDATKELAEIKQLNVALAEQIVSLRVRCTRHEERAERERDLKHQAEEVNNKLRTRIKELEDRLRQLVRFPSALH